VWLDTNEIGKSVSSHFSLCSRDIHVTRFTIRKSLFKAGGHYGESETSKTRNSFIPQQAGESSCGEMIKEKSRERTITITFH
jgi:hypothetical protein